MARIFRCVSITDARCGTETWALPSRSALVSFVKTFHGPGGATDVARACDWLSAFLSLLGSQRSRRRYATEKTRLFVVNYCLRGLKHPNHVMENLTKDQGELKRSILVRLI